MQKRPTSTPEMATDHSIRGRVHKLTRVIRVTTWLQLGRSQTKTVYERAHRLTAPFQQSRDICLLLLRVCPLLIFLHNCD